MKCLWGGVLASRPNRSRCVNTGSGQWRLRRAWPDQPRRRCGSPAKTDANIRCIRSQCRAKVDLVTGYLLVTGHGRGVHMRLIPMGSGYRYAGRGVWFDGMRGQAVLNWGRPDEVPCKVMQE